MSDKGLAIITGASQGIGACIAKGLATDGYQTVLIARNQNRLQSIANEIKSLKNTSEPICISVDITNHRELKQDLKEKTNERNISVLVNCAGLWLDGSLEESEENVLKIFDVNVISPYLILQEVVKKMKKQRDGYIFNISSRAGRYGFSNGGLYSASKFALVGLSESLYRELASFNIKVTAICPGWVKTEMAKDAGTPLKDDEMIQPEDILNSIKYLLRLSKSACIKELLLECTKSML